MTRNKAKARMRRKKVRKSVMMMAFWKRERSFGVDFGSDS